MHSLRTLVVSVLVLSGSQDKWRYQGVDHSETSRLPILTVDHPLLTLAITCEEADVSLNNGSVELTSLEACLAYYTRERVIGDFGIHDASGNVRIDKVSVLSILHMLCACHVHASSMSS